MRSLPRVRAGSRRLVFIAGAVVVILAATGLALGLALPRSGAAPAARDDKGWVASWAASPMAGSSADNTTPGLRDQTVRNIIFTSAGGNALRVQVSNTFGTAPLTVGKVSVGAVRDRAAVTPQTNQGVTFGGSASVTIPPGQQAFSDPVAVRVLPLQRWAVSLYLPGATGPATSHSDAQQTTYVAAGDHAGDTAGTAYRTTTTSWFFLDEVDVRSATAAGTIVAFGDSITDGYHSKMDSDGRWPNYLARRLHQALGDRAPGVVDAGISGNRVLQDSPCYGVSARARFQRDALSEPAVKAVIILEGTNDFGFAGSADGCHPSSPPVTAAQIEAGFTGLIKMAHARGVRVYLGTLLPPFRNWPGAAESGSVAIWQELNAWIRASSGFDGMIDFAKVVTDPRAPLAMSPAYDSGDGFHPNNAGYQAMADAIPLRFAR
jgi:lysophospholipase L1-like esterase